MRPLIAGLLAAAVAAPAALSAAAPHVRLVGRAPAVVAGVGFYATERVAVTVTDGTTRLRTTVETNARGGFLARFTRDLPAGACTQVVVTALGTRGDRAAWKTPPQVCGAPPQP